MNVTGNCDSSLQYVFGNGESESSLDVKVTVDSITGSASALTEEHQTALKNAFSFDPSEFTLFYPGIGSKEVALTFANVDIPKGTYDVKIHIAPEAGCGVGAADVIFTITVTEPTAVDTQWPDVQITSPSTGGKFLLHAPINVIFTAKDPLEAGAGTGVTAVRASISGCNGAFSQNIDDLDKDPLPPVGANVLVTAKSTIDANWIGTFALKAEADDAANHTGEASISFSVGVGVSTLPPISVPGRQFKAGSTVPIKWKITDANGFPMEPKAGIKVTVISPSSQEEDRYAGDGAENIRWELDEFGNADQYITNYQINETGTYTVKISVPDQCGSDAEQGEFTFISSTKGGK